MVTIVLIDECSHQNYSIKPSYIKIINYRLKEDRIMVLDLRDEKIVELLNKINKDMDEVMKIIDGGNEKELEEVLDEDEYSKIYDAIMGMKEYG